MIHTPRRIAPGDEELPLIQADEKVARGCGPREILRQVERNLGQQAEREHGLLLLRRQRREELTRERLEHLGSGLARLAEPLDVGSQISRGRPVGQEHESGGPAASRGDVHGRGTLAHPAGDQGACLGLRELQDRLVDDCQPPFERQLRQLVRRERAADARAVQVLRQLPQHDGQHRSELRNLEAMVQIVDDDQPGSFQLLEVRPEKAPRELRRLIGVFGPEYRKVARRAGWLEAAEPMEEARDVLVAFVHPVPQVGDGILLQVVEDRRGFAVSRRCRNPADATAQRVADRRDDTAAPNDPDRSQQPSAPGCGSGPHDRRRL